MGRRPLARILVTGAIVVALGVGPDPAPPDASAPPAAGTRPHRSPGAMGFGHPTTALELNQGQADPGIRFLARAGANRAFIRPHETVLALRGGADGDGDVEGPSGAVVHLGFDGADPDAASTPLDPRRGRVNYLVGDDPSRWRTNVPTYGRAKFTGVWPGIDVIYHAGDEGLRYDFHVAPGVDPAGVGLTIGGADGVRLDPAGQLAIDTPVGTLVQKAPVVYQSSGRHRRRVGASYVVNGNRIGFRLGRYDRGRPLVIDPTIIYSTYLGGSAADSGESIEVDPTGQVHVTGTTASSDFPTRNPASGHRGGTDAFVSKLNAEGSDLVYSTYLGGGGDDQGRGIALDSAGNAHVTGDTASTDFPTQTPLEGDQPGIDAFLAVLTPAGALAYSTYFGGNGADRGTSVAVLPSVGSVVTGSTDSSDFAPSGDQPGTDAFLASIRHTTNDAIFGYFGGSGADSGSAVAQTGGLIYVAGTTESPDFPVLNALRPDQPGTDAFLIKLEDDGSVLYSTYLGGNGEDTGRGVAADVSGAYLTGDTESTDFPSVNPVQGDAPGRDVFVSKINPGGSALLYSTYLGGNDFDFGAGEGIAVDGNGAAYVVGGTESTDFPTLDPLHADRAFSDGFVTRLTPAGALSYSTYLGGNGGESAADVDVDGAGAAYVTGGTAGDFPTVNPFQGTVLSNAAFVTKIADLTTTTTSTSSTTSTTTGGGGGSTTSTTGGGGGSTTSTTGGGGGSTTSTTGGTTTTTAGGGGGPNPSGGGATIGIFDPGVTVIAVPGQSTFSPIALPLGLGAARSAVGGSGGQQQQQQQQSVVGSAPAGTAPSASSPSAPAAAASSAAAAAPAPAAPVAASGGRVPFTGARSAPVGLTGVATVTLGALLVLNARTARRRHRLRRPPALPRI